MRNENRPCDHLHPVSSSRIMKTATCGFDAIRIESAKNGETMQDHDQKNAYSARAAAFRRFNEWEEQHLLELDPEQTLAAIGALYELIPPEVRKRPVDTEGVRKMHAALSCLKG